MSVQLPERLADLLTREKRAFAYLSTVLQDGTPQVTPIWFDYDGAHIIMNTARGRVKERAIRRRPNVAMVIADPADPYRFMQIRGRVVEMTEEGAYDMICSLNEKYHGERSFPKRPGEIRVTFKVLPEHVFPKQ